MNRDDILKAVKEAIVESIDVEMNEISETSTLIGDLDAESLDIIDLLFKTGKQLGKKVSMKELQSTIRGEISEEEFIDESGAVSEKGVKHLRHLFGERVDDFPQGLTSKDMLKLLDVNYIVTVFEERLGE